MGVDDRHAHRRARGETELGGCRFVETARALAHRTHLGPDARPALVGQGTEPDLTKVVLAEASAGFVTEVGPFADRRAERTNVPARSPPDQEVWEVEEQLGLLPRRGVSLGEPEQLRRLHLRRDDATDVAQDLVPQRVDAERLIGRPVVHPDDDVLPIEAGWADADGAALAVERDQRTGRVEADAGHVARSEPALGHRLVHSDAYRAPDVVGGLFDEIRLGTEDLDGFDADPEPSASAVEEPGPRAAGADVHPEIRARGHDLGDATPAPLRLEVVSASHAIPRPRSPRRRLRGSRRLPSRPSKAS